MPYVDVQTIHNPSTGAIAPAAWGDGLRDNQEFFIDPPVASVYHSAAVSVANSTDTTLNANSETFDNDAMHSTVTQTSRITAQTAGRYLFTTAASFAANATGNRKVEFLLNGSPVGGGTLVGNAGAANSTAIVTVKAIVLAVSDYVEVRVQQQSGGALNVTLTEFTAIFLTR